MRTISLLIILSICAIANAEVARGAAPTTASAQGSPVNTDYRQKLLDLATADQSIRSETMKKFTPAQLQSDKGAARALALEIHASQQKNQQMLSALIEEYGFPDNAAVGEDGAHAAFLVAPHSTDKEFRASFARQIESAVSRGVYSMTDRAYFIDRDRVFAGRPQLYGTQRKPDGQPFDVENPEELAKRRAAAGLAPDDSAK